MASCCSVLHEALPYASWTGFYRVVEPELLRIGPYQGPPGCLEIRFGSGRLRRRRGPAGDPGGRRRPRLPRATSPATRGRAREIVVPVRDAAGRLAAVLDVDSHQTGAFDAADREGLERLAARLSPHLAG